MKDKITITNFLKKYTGVSRSEIVRHIKSGNIPSELIGKTYYIDEDETLKEFNIPTILSPDSFITMGNACKKYNVSAKSFNDYIKAGKIEAYLVLDKRYLRESDIENVIDTINKNKLRMNRSSQDRTVEFTDKIKEKIGSEYTVIDRYVNQKTRIKIRHNTCGNVFLAYPSNILYKKKADGCPKCFGTHRYTDDELRKIINESSYNTYELVSSEGYRNNKSKILIKHSISSCKGNNLPYKVNLNAFLNGEGHCPFCTMSAGEEQIFNILLKKGIEFDYHERYMYNTMGYGFFDFVLNNLEKMVVIEYDGEQHFRDSNFSDFESTSQRDFNKNTAVSDDDNIIMIRVSYNNFRKLENIVDIILNKEYDKLRDYSLGKYEQLLGKSVVLADNIYYIG